MKNIILLLLFIPLLSFGQIDLIYPENNIRDSFFGKVYDVTSQGGLNVRDKPGSDGKKIATLLVDDLVYLLEKTDISLTINDLNKSTGETKEISGHWVKIETLDPPKLKGNKVLWKDSYDIIVGYVFDGFLRKLENSTGNNKLVIPQKDLTEKNKMFYYQNKPYTGYSIKKIEWEKENADGKFAGTTTYRNLYFQGKLYYKGQGCWEIWDGEQCCSREEEFWGNGNLKAKANYKECNEGGSRTGYYENGQLKYDDYIAYEGLNWGSRKEFHPNGNLKYEQTFTEATMFRYYTGSPTEYVLNIKTGKYEIKKGLDREDEVEVRRNVHYDKKLLDPEFSEELIGQETNMWQENYFHINGKIKRIHQFVYYEHLTDNHDAWLLSYWIFLNGKYINLEFASKEQKEQAGLIVNQCWDEDGNKIKCD